MFVSKHLPEHSFGTLKTVVPFFLSASLSAQRPGFEPTPVHLRFVIHNVALGQVCPPPPQELGFSPVRTIMIALHAILLLRTLYIPRNQNAVN